MGGPGGVGVRIELLAFLPVGKLVFIDRWFTVQKLDQLLNVLVPPTVNYLSQYDPGC